MLTFSSFLTRSLELFGHKTSILLITSIKFSKTRKNHFSSSGSRNVESCTFEESNLVFNKISNHNVRFCTKKIKGYFKSNRLKDALQLFEKMPVRDAVAWNSIIKGSLDCDDLSLAKKFFDEMPDKNMVSWTTMINGYMNFGMVEVAELLFRQMPYKDAAVRNSMVHGYFINGRVDEAIKMFKQMPSKNVISWTSMIGGLNKNGRSYDSLKLFKHMVHNGIEPTISTYTCLISACATASALDLGLQIHACIIKLGLFFDEFVASSLITLYANCKQVENSCKVFSERVHDSVVVWTSLITGYSLNLKHDNAIEVFSEMIRKGIVPNDSSFTSVLNSCCALVSLNSGKIIHAEATKLGFEAHVFVGNSLVTFYSKCGSIQEAVKAFEGINKKNLVSWNSIIVGCAQYGYGMWSLAFFAKMLRVEVKPDEVTFTGLLYAANNSKGFPKARQIFQYFNKYTSIELNYLHYACMVDIICRCGNLDEAEEFINNMHMHANLHFLLALLSACTIHSNFEMAERASKRILEKDPNCTAAYTLLSNLYASAGRWSDVSRIRSEMKFRGLVKQEGSSWLTQNVKSPKSHPAGQGDRTLLE